MGQLLMAKTITRQNFRTPLQGLRALETGLGREDASSEVWEFLPGGKRGKSRDG
jgi:hypothetical protein